VPEIVGKIYTIILLEGILGEIPQIRLLERMAEKITINILDLEAITRKKYYHNKYF